jgi:hypothetical protein
MRGTASGWPANSFQREAASAIAMFICRKWTGSATLARPSPANQAPTRCEKHAVTPTSSDTDPEELEDSVERDVQPPEPVEEEEQAEADQQAAAHDADDAVVVAQPA